jgi:peptide/nickel transport system substrate-binding protein
MVRAILVALTLVMASAQAPDTVAQNKPEPKPTVLHFTESEGPRTLDPHLAGDVVSSRQCMHAYECLLEYDPFNPGTLQPCIAAAMPTYDAGKLTYTFTIRDDVRFADNPCFEDHKGRLATAQDVAWSLKRMAAHPESAGYWTFEGTIKGLDKFRETASALVEKGEVKEWRKLLDKPIDGIQAPDARTLLIRLNQPCPQLLHVLALPFGAVVAHEACDKRSLTSSAVGTGPFKIKQFDKPFIAQGSGDALLFAGRQETEQQVDGHGIDP